MKSPSKEQEIQMKLSPEEKEIIEHYRKEREFLKPVAEGFAKENIYIINDDIDFPDLISESEKEKIINKFRNGFELIVPINHRFECLLDLDREEEWYSDNGKLECMNADWAKKNLKNIKKLKK